MTIRGLDRLTARIAAIRQAAQRASDPAAAAGGEVLREAMAAGAPVDEGELRDSHIVAPSGSGAVDVGPTAPHAVFVHNGTEKMSPQPWMLEAADDARAATATAVRDVLRDAISGAA